MGVNVNSMPCIGASLLLFFVCECCFWLGSLYHIHIHTYNLIVLCCVVAHSFALDNQRRNYLAKAMAKGKFAIQKPLKLPYLNDPYATNMHVDVGDYLLNMRSIFCSDMLNNCFDKAPYALLFSYLLILQIYFVRTNHFLLNRECQQHIQIDSRRCEYIQQEMSEQRDEGSFDGVTIHSRTTSECIINRNRLIPFIVYLFTVEQCNLLLGKIIQAEPYRNCSCRYAIININIGRYEFPIFSIRHQMLGR